MSQHLGKEKMMNEKNTSFWKVSGVFLLILVMALVGWFGMQARVPEFSALSIVSSVVCIWLSRFGNEDIVLAGVLFGICGALAWVSPVRPFMRVVCLGVVAVYRYGVKKERFSDLELCCMLFLGMPSP